MVAWECSLGMVAPRAKKPRRGDLPMEEPGPTPFFLFFSGAASEQFTGGTHSRR